MVNIVVELLHHMLIHHLNTFFEEAPTLSSAELCLHMRVERDKIGIYELPL